MNLKNKKALITGGSKGLGLAVVNALVANEANVTVAARDKIFLDKIYGTNVSIAPGDATDKIFMDKIIEDIQPALLILNAGATPAMTPIDEQDWESFSMIWNADVKAGLFGIQAALKTPLPPGSRVFIVSSGAALGGSPLSGGYAGAKRMLWFMAQYANEIAKERSLGISFQAILPMQIIVETNLGRQAAGAYAQRKNITIENFIAARGNKSLSPKEYAGYFIKLLTDESYADGIAYGINYDGINKL